MPRTAAVPVHPPRTAGRGTPGGQHLPRLAAIRVQPAGLRPGVRKPGHEQPQMLDSRMPEPARRPAPPQDNAIPPAYASSSAPAIPAKPDLTQERVRLRNHAQLIVEHRPVPVPRQQPHRKCLTPSPVLVPDSNNYSQRRDNTGGDALQNPLRVALTQRPTTPDAPGENRKHRLAPTAPHRTSPAPRRPLSLGLPPWTPFGFVSPPYRVLPGTGRRKGTSGFLSLMAGRTGSWPSTCRPAERQGREGAGCCG